MKKLFSTPLPVATSKHLVFANRSPTYFSKNNNLLRSLAPSDPIHQGKDSHVLHLSPLIRRLAWSNRVISQAEKLISLSFWSAARLVFPNAHLFYNLHDGDRAHVWVVKSFWFTRPSLT